ncbi:MAG: branched-chain amino acid transport system ATP-binding protein [Parcubacteria group bacterium Gr01-1014_8]|nr:MAG: branched-chain amino acid transport system ATP-binding protein [Parcubacteria group bacterium Gr01-1014_8]
MKDTLLQLKDAYVQYGGVTALADATVRIDDGEIAALMGPNGAGKSTVLKALFGIAPMTHGKVLWHEQELKPVPYEMAARGIAYVPQGRQVFKNLTVYENLELGGYALPNRKDTKKNIEAVLHIFPAIEEKLNTKAGLLSGGQQQMLTIARGLVSDPKVLLLDEPSLGLAPKIVKDVFEKIKEINAIRKIAIVVVEHSVKSVLSIAHRAYILSRGKIFAEKSAQELMTSDTLSKAFLGTS